MSGAQYPYFGRLHRPPDIGFSSSQWVPGSQGDRLVVILDGQLEQSVVLMWGRT